MKVKFVAIFYFNVVITFVPGVSDPALRDVPLAPFRAPNPSDPF